MDPLEAWLSLEASKLALARLDARVARLAASRLAVPSACAYIALATLGYAREQTANAQAAALAADAFETATQAANDAQNAVSDAFTRYDDAERTSAGADARIALATTVIDGSKLSTEQARTARAALAQKAVAAAAQYRADRDAAESDLAKSQSVLAQARAALAKANKEREDFRAADRQKRFPGDLRETPMPAQLNQAVEQASATIAQRRTAVDEAKRHLANASAPGTAVVPPPRSLPSAPNAELAARTSTGGSGDVESALPAREALVLASAAAKAEVARAQADWSQKQNELERTLASAAAAQKSVHDLNERPPSPISLPVIGISVQPQIFFAAAPLLLVVLFADWLSAAAGLRRAAKVVLGRAAASGVPSEDVTPLLSGLAIDRTLDRVRDVACAVFVIGVLLQVYFANGHWWTAAAIPVVGAIIAFDAALQAMHRRRAAHAALPSPVAAAGP